MNNRNYHHGDLKNALIDAGIEILKREGVQALSLRKAAQRAGVSHSAPYAHFRDKQALIAAISTRGLQQLYERASVVADHFHQDPLNQLHAVAWCFTEFALQDPGLFKVIFSSIIQREHDYPEFVEISHRNFTLLVELVHNCQFAGILKPGDVEIAAISIWSLVHGFIELVLEKQVPSAILAREETHSLLIKVLDQVVVKVYSPNQ